MSVLTPFIKSVLLNSTDYSELWCIPLCAVRHRDSTILHLHLHGNKSLSEYRSFNRTQYSLQIKIVILIWSNNVQPLPRLCVRMSRLNVDNSSSLLFSSLFFSSLLFSSLLFSSLLSTDEKQWRVSTLATPFLRVLWLLLCSQPCRFSDDRCVRLRRRGKSAANLCEYVMHI